MTRRYVPALLLTLALSAVAVLARAESPPEWVLAIVDVETTGLDPAYHEMVDLGAIYVDPDGRELGRFFVRIRPRHPQRLDPGAAAVNGYSEARWHELGAVEEAEAVRRWLEFHATLAAGHRVVFTALNVWFDQAFTTALLARNGKRWRDLFHYQVLDLPSMAWSQGARDLAGGALASRYGIAAETRDPLEHTGSTGVEFNLTLYRAILATRPSSPAASPAR
jgi:DNA polymerase III epsilon subunit-like protein